MSLALSAPEMELTEAEAEQYAKSVGTVARHYDMGASAKTLDWFNLLTTMGAIYGVRVMQIANRRKDERAGRRTAAPRAADAAPAAEQPHVDAEGNIGGVDWSLMVGPGARPQ